MCVGIYKHAHWHNHNYYIQTHTQTQSHIQTCTHTDLFEVKAATDLIEELPPGVWRSWLMFGRIDVFQGWSPSNLGEHRWMYIVTPVQPWSRGWWRRWDSHGRTRGRGWGVTSWGWGHISRGWRCWRKCRGPWRGWGCHCWGHCLVGWRGHWRWGLALSTGGWGRRGWGSHGTLDRGTVGWQGWGNCGSPLWGHRRGHRGGHSRATGMGWGRGLSHPAWGRWRSCKKKQLLVVN